MRNENIEMSIKDRYKKREKDFKKKMKYEFSKYVMSKYFILNLPIFITQRIIFTIFGGASIFSCIISPIVFESYFYGSSRILSEGVAELFGNLSDDILGFTIVALFGQFFLRTFEYGYFGQEREEEHLPFNFKFHFDEFKYALTQVILFLFYFLAFRSLLWIFFNYQAIASISYGELLDLIFGSAMYVIGLVASIITIVDYLKRRWSA